MRDKLAELPKSQSRELRRTLYPTAQDCAADKQGRIMLASALREYAGIGESLTVIGAGDYAEIWNDAAWEEYQKSREDTPLETAMDLLDL
jgi:MraZ protein